MFSASEFSIEIERILSSCSFTCIMISLRTEGKNQALVGALPFCGEYPGPRSEDKSRSSNQMDGISIADGGKLADS